MKTLFNISLLPHKKLLGTIIQYVEYFQSRKRYLDATEILENALEKLNRAYFLEDVKWYEIIC